MRLLNAAAANLRLFGVLIVLVVAFGLSLGIGLTATGVLATHDDPNTIHACVGPLSHVARIVEDPEDCAYYDEVVEWEGLAATSDLEDRLEALEMLLACAQSEAGVNPAINDIVFDGCNVHVRSGSGATDGTLNGLGNLIVGYNEDFADVRSGSHNLIVGSQHSYTSYGGFVAGFNNTISGAQSSVTGGQGNDAIGQRSSVSGGGGNTASELRSSVSGGSGNIASGIASSVNGGRNNEASGGTSSVNGGFGNSAMSADSSVSGGESNVASNDQATVGGGSGNTASGQQSFAGGGAGNTASGTQSSVSGGQGNRASGSHSSVSGGQGNTAGDTTIPSDETIGRWSSVRGGQGNNATGDWSTVSGGLNRSTDPAVDPFPADDHDWVAGGLAEDF